MSSTLLPLLASAVNMGGHMQLPLSWGRQTVLPAEVPIPHVDAVAPEAAIYLTIKIDLAGKTTRDGSLLKTQADVTSYLLQYASLAVVPFYAFGASKDSPWYRLSVGTCKKEEINEMLGKLEQALKALA